MNCNCEQCRREKQGSSIGKVASSIAEKATKMAVKAVVGTAVTSLTGNPVAGYLSAQAAGGVSGVEDLLN